MAAARCALIGVLIWFLSTNFVNVDSAIIYSQSGDKFCLVNNIIDGGAVNNASYDIVDFAFFNLSQVDSNIDIAGRFHYDKIFIWHNGIFLKSFRISLGNISSPFAYGFGSHILLTFFNCFGSNINSFCRGLPDILKSEPKANNFGAVIGFNFGRANPRPLIGLHCGQLALHHCPLAAHSAELENGGYKQEASKDAYNFRPTNKVPIKIIFGLFGILVAAVFSCVGCLCFTFWSGWRSWLALGAGLVSAFFFVCQSAPLIGLI